MDAAVSKEYGGIIIFFSTRLISARDSLIELCAHLNSNALTRSIHKCLSLGYQQRVLLAKLRKAGVLHVDITHTNEAANPWRIWERLNADESALRIESHLSRLCPFLRYRPISEQNELITCGAYRNRMVLGGRRLHEVCQAATYLHCEYYLNPRAVE